jgi:TRAP-type C4-dicarboxylate transport system permease small subunit
MSGESKHPASGLYGLAGSLNRLLEIVCGLLMAAMVVIVWLGVFSRYFVDIGLTWTEELARYVMIWGALLAVPIGAYKREHIGLDLVFRRFPPSMQRAVRFALDLIGLAFFLFLTWFGAGMTVKGLNQYATIFHMNMAVPFAAVPVSSALTAFMILAVMGREKHEDEAHELGVMND